MNIYFPKIILKIIKKYLAVVSYPIQIIPTRKFHREIPNNILAKISNLGVVRRSLTSRNDTFDTFGKVKERALINLSKDVQYLSMNLLGNGFSDSHIAFIPKKSAANRWNGEDRKLKLWAQNIFYVNYEFFSTPIFFWFHKLNNIPFPYHMQENNQVKKLMNSLGLQKTGSQYKLSATTSIKHSPNNLNYWHIEFVISDFRGIEVERNKIGSADKSRAINTQSWATQCAYYALNDILLNSGKKTLTNFGPVPRNSYRKRKPVMNESL